MWIQIAVAVELMALIGAVAVLITKRTHVAFFTGFNAMALVTGIYVWHAGLGLRGAVVIALVTCYLLRMNWVLIFWSGNTAVSKLDERTPSPGKLFLPFVLSNTVGWAYCLPFYFALQRSGPLGLTDAVAIAVYVLGTVFHFGSDYQKRRFKRQPDSAGRILDTGFWSLSRHPNYFGDFIIYVSFAVVGASIWGWIGPLLNLLQYAFDAIPKSEKWAAERYGDAWDAYRSRTKVFIPFLV